MKTVHCKKDAASKRWYLVDAKDQALGRLASRVAMILRGKHTPRYTPHADCGDFVVVVNAEKVKLTGSKLQKKKYYRHSGWPGGLKEKTAAEMLERHPTRVITTAVKGMLPKGPLGYSLIKKLKVYAGEEHPHKAQNPQPIDLEGIK
ncbi:MAG: 50S ribosomal protein L13 [Deltaproteobacteria bacterium]|nr:MAG: 50S ribosomal protein L13 [Deltaproteobacteria bacterium]